MDRVNPESVLLRDALNRHLGQTFQIGLHRVLLDMPKIVKLSSRAEELEHQLTIDFSTEHALRIPSRLWHDHTTNLWKPTSPTCQQNSNDSNIGRLDEVGKNELLSTALSSFSHHKMVDGGHRDLVCDSPRRRYESRVLSTSSHGFFEDQQPCDAPMSLSRSSSAFVSLQSLC
jgi:hypothetical protein